MQITNTFIMVINEIAMLNMIRSYSKINHKIGLHTWLWKLIVKLSFKYIIWESIQFVIFENENHCLQLAIIYGWSYKHITTLAHTFQHYMMISQNIHRPADDTNDDHNCWGCIDAFATVTSVDGDANTTIDNIVGEVFAAIKAGVIEADTVNFTDHSLLRQLWFP